MLKKIISSAPINVDVAALVMRLGFGIFMFTLHGYGKLTRWDELQNDFPEPLGIPMALGAALTIFAEFFCAILVTIGLFTRLACIPLIICMLVAGFNIHAGDPWGDKEGSLTYAVALAGIMMMGAGKYSIDHVIARKM